MTDKYIMMIMGIVLAICPSCNNREPERLQSGGVENIDKERLEAVERQKIFFGHQSVGANILDGVAKLKKSSMSIAVNIVEYDKSRLSDAPVLAQAAVGRNQYPETKIDAFTEIVRGGVGTWADLALFKFCYVDVTSKTDVNTLFTSYREAMATLKSEYPQTTFVHVTVPLVSRSQGWKDVVKRILGRKLGSDDDNIKRNEYNQLLLREYDGKEPVFDLALAESTHADGTRESFAVKGKQYFALAKEYASDGAHLNDLGQRQVAVQFMSALARAAKKN